MSSVIDIEALAAEAVSLVEEQEKTAAPIVDEPEELSTDIGKALKQAAELIRGYSGREVTNDDLAAYTGAPQKTASTREILSPENPSELGDQFRKLAAQVRETGDKIAEDRLIKAAHTLNAAVALKHLISDVKSN